MVVNWEPSARRDIENQYRWYQSNMGGTAAKKFLKGIISDGSLLSKNPMLGCQEEELNKIYKEQIWRSLTSGRRYKIIYFVDDQVIRIMAVWACVREKKALKRIIKKGK